MYIELSNKVISTKGIRAFYCYGNGSFSGGNLKIIYDDGTETEYRYKKECTAKTDYETMKKILIGEINE